MIQQRTSSAFKSFIRKVLCTKIFFRRKNQYKIKSMPLTIPTQKLDKISTRVVSWNLFHQRCACTVRASTLISFNLIHSIRLNEGKMYSVRSFVYLSWVKADKSFVGTSHYSTTHVDVHPLILSYLPHSSTL